MERFSITENYVENCYKDFSDEDLYNEAVLIRYCNNFLMLHEVNTFMFEYLDFIEDKIMYEIVCRFGRHFLNKSE